MKLTILGVDFPVSDKVIYATEEASREYINAMKYIPTIATCPDWYKIHQGKCVNCYEQETMIQDWKEKIIDVLSEHYNDIFYGDIEPEKQNDDVINFVESLLEEKQHKWYDIGANHMRALCEEGEEKRLKIAIKEEREIAYEEGKRYGHDLGINYANQIPDEETENRIRNAVLSEVEKEVEKKLEKWDESAAELEDGWGNYGVCLPWELKEKKAELSTIINNLRVK